MDNPGEITLLLHRAHQGDADAFDAVARAVYRDLLLRARRLIARRRGSGRMTITLEPADLVQETFLKLPAQRTRFRNRQHFYAIATRVMLRVLLDYHKARTRRKRDGGQFRVSLSALGPKEAVAPHATVPEVVLALDELERLDPRLAQVVQLRVLWGMTVAETAEVVGASASTIQRDWRFARSWLADRLNT